MHFEMSRVTESDFDELLEIQYSAFSVVPMHEALFGPNTAEQRARIKADFIKSMNSDPSDMWMKLVDKSNGRIVSAALWKIYPSWNKNEERHDGQAPWFEGEERTMAEFLMKDFMDRRVKYMWNHPHVLLYILFTHPDYQRCGAGSIHVKWGTDLADRLLVPCWVEASPFGHHLYEENGFRDVEQVCTRTKKWVGEYTMMRRAPKTRLDAGRTVILNGH